MKIKSVPAECVSSFSLSAIELSGIGSYYNTARLDVKPLTIICGNNGSGKSTWFKALEYLNELTEKRPNLLKLAEPLYFNRFNPNKARSHQVTIDDDKSYEDVNAPYIKLVLTCVKPSVLKVFSDPFGLTVAETKVEPQEEVEVKVSCSERVVKEEKEELINGEKHIFNEYDKSIKSIVVSLETKKLLLKVRSSACFVKQSTKTQWTHQVDLRFNALDKHNQTVDLMSAEILWGNVLDVITLWAESHFYIHAIRPLVDKIKDLPGQNEAEQKVKSLYNKRHVGRGGENTYHLCHYYSANHVLNPIDGFPYVGTDIVEESFFPINEKKKELNLLDKIFKLSKSVAISPKFWSLLSEYKEWKKFEKYVFCNSQKLINNFPLTKGIVQSVQEPGSSKYSMFIHALNEEQERLYRLYNSDYADRCLIEPFTVDASDLSNSEFNNFICLLTNILDVSIRELFSQKGSIATWIVDVFSKFDKDDYLPARFLAIKYKNTPSLIHKFDWNNIVMLPPRDIVSLSIPVTLNYWLAKLVNVNTSSKKELRDSSQFIGFMFPVRKFKPIKTKKIENEFPVVAADDEKSKVELNCYTDHHFPSSANPTYFSAGFHQVYPITAQFSFMRVHSA